jgi:hypothetical protein
VLSWTAAASPAFPRSAPGHAVLAVHYPGAYGGYAAPSGPGYGAPYFRPPPFQQGCHPSAPSWRADGSRERCKPWRGNPGPPQGQRAPTGGNGRHVHHSPRLPDLPWHDLIPAAMIGIGLLALHQLTKHKPTHKSPPSVQVTLGLDAGHVRIIRGDPSPEPGLAARSAPRVPNATIQRGKVLSWPIPG